MRVLASIVMSLALLTGLAACGGGGDDKNSDDGQVATEFGTAKPEDSRASPAEVADGFTQLNKYADEVLAKLGVDAAATSEAQERILTIWESILGTVKANDEATYEKLDTALNLLMDAKGADAKAQAQGAAESVRESGDDYVKRYPGTSSAAPESSDAPTGEDAGSGDSGGLSY